MNKTKYIGIIAAVFVVIILVNPVSSIAVNQNDKTSEKSNISTNDGDKIVGEIIYGGGSDNIRTYYDEIEISLLPGQKEEITFVVNCKYIDDTFPGDSCTFFLMVDPPSGKRVTHHVKDNLIEDNSWEGELRLTCSFELSGLEPQYRVLQFGFDAERVEYKEIILKITRVDITPGIQITKPIKGHEYINNEDKGPSSNGQTTVKGPLTIVAELPSDWVKNYDVWVRFFVDNDLKAELNKFSYQGDKCSISYTWVGKEDNSMHSIKVAGFDVYGNEASDEISIYTSKTKSSEIHYEIHNLIDYIRLLLNKRFL